jgi:ABC-2 type transport system permease protein
MSRRDISFTNGQQLYAIVPFVERFNNPWFPINWAGRGLVELGSGNWLLGILLVVLTLALFSGGFWIALVTSERWYYTGWAGMQVVARKKRSTSMSASTLPRETLASRLRQLVPAPVRSVVQKDFLVLRRDLRNFSQLVTPLIFGVIYAISFLRGGALPADASPYLKALASYGTVLIALMVGSSLVTRLGSMGFSQEGKNYWMLKVSPVRPMHLLVAKFIVAYLPPVVIGSLIVLVLSTFRPTSILSIVYGMLILIFSLMPMTGILVAFGVAGANFNWDDPRKMTSGRFGCMGMIVMSVYSLVTLGLFVVPPVLALLLRQPEIYGEAVGLLLGGVFSVGGALSALWLASSRVERLGEE